MLIKNEIDRLLNKIRLTPEISVKIEMVLRNYEADDEVIEEKLEAVIKLIVNK